VCRTVVGRSSRQDTGFIGRGKSAKRAVSVVCAPVSAHLIEFASGAQPRVAVLPDILLSIVESELALKWVSLSMEEMP
jgi:hypothetical protein